MAELWATEELPGVAWDGLQQKNPPRDPDLAGQHLTSSKTVILLTPSPEYL